MATKPQTKGKNGTSKEAAEHKRRLFITAYLNNGGNATQAAISAGYSEKTAHVIGSRLLKEVKNEVEQKKEKIASKFELSLERTLQEIARIAYSDPRNFYNEDGSLKSIHELDDDTAAALAGMDIVEMAGGAELGGDAGVKHIPMHTKKIKIWDKNAALEKAMKFFGAYEKDNKQKQPVVLQLSDTDEAL